MGLNIEYGINYILVLYIKFAENVRYGQIGKMCFAMIAFMC
jgi:hypothetical protein